MKLITTLLTLGLALSSPAFAGKPGKEGKKGGHKEVGEALKAADKNGNNTIDAEEVAALNEALGKAGPDSGLKALDKDGDGKLGEDEVKAINEHMAKHADGEKKKKNK
jgi:Ca2+-binding EF-hand superfamily protein